MTERRKLWVVLDMATCWLLLRLWPTVGLLRWRHALLVEWRHG